MPRRNPPPRRAPREPAGGLQPPRMTPIDPGSASSSIRFSAVDRLVLAGIEPLDLFGAEDAGELREERPLLVAEVRYGDRLQLTDEPQQALGVARLAGHLRLGEEVEDLAVLRMGHGLELLDRGSSLRLAGPRRGRGCGCGRCRHSP